jgi:hypothetical protein
MFSVIGVEKSYGTFSHCLYHQKVYHSISGVLGSAATSFKSTICLSGYVIKFEFHVKSIL